MTITSGTIDILQLPFVETSGAETLKNVYLDDGSKKIPTPKFFFKVVLDSKNKQGVVFIGKLEVQQLNFFNLIPILVLNNSHLRAQDVVGVKCKNVVNQITWVTFDHVNLSRGATSACTVKDFVDSYPNTVVIVDPAQYALLTSY